METFHLHVTGLLDSDFPHVSLRLKHAGVGIDLHVYPTPDPPDDGKPTTAYDLVFENTPAHPYMLEFLRQHGRQESSVEENDWHLDMDAALRHDDPDVSERASSLLLHAAVENYVRVCRSMAPFGHPLLQDVLDTAFRTAKRTQQQQQGPHDEQEG